MRDVAVELVVAASENDVIGRRNRLPWRLPADMRHFRALTVTRNVLMGRKTYDSIGKALPDRVNIVLSRSGFAPADAKAVRSVPEALAAVEGSAPLMVIGGGDVYRVCMPFAQRIHLTLVHARISDGDTFFADWREPQWRETARVRHEADDKNDFAYSFVTLERTAAP